MPTTAFVPGVRPTTSDANPTVLVSPQTTLAESVGAPTWPVTVPFGVPSAAKVTVVQVPFVAGPVTAMTGSWVAGSPAIAAGARIARPEAMQSSLRGHV